MSEDEMRRRIGGAVRESRPADVKRDEGEAQMPREMATNTCAMRASAASMLHSEAASLRHQADDLDALAKVAAFVENTPAEQALWMLVIRNRNR